MKILVAFIAINNTNARWNKFCTGTAIVIIHLNKKWIYRYVDNSSKNNIDIININKLIRINKELIRIEKKKKKKNV